MKAGISVDSPLGPFTVNTGLHGIFIFLVLGPVARKKMALLTILFLARTCRLVNPSSCRHFFTAQHARKQAAAFFAMRE